MEKEIQVEGHSRLVTNGTVRGPRRPAAIPDLQPPLSPKPGPRRPVAGLWALVMVVVPALLLDNDNRVWAGLGLLGLCIPAWTAWYRLYQRKTDVHP